MAALACCIAFIKKASELGKKIYIYICTYVYSVYLSQREEKENPHLKTHHLFA